MQYPAAPRPIKIYRGGQYLPNTLKEPFSCWLSISVGRFFTTSFVPLAPALPPSRPRILGPPACALALCSFVIHDHVRLTAARVPFFVALFSFPPLPPLAAPLSPRPPLGCLRFGLDFFAGRRLLLLVLISSSSGRSRAAIGICTGDSDGSNCSADLLPDKERRRSETSYFTVKIFLLLSFPLCFQIFLPFSS